jgi:hypothetical protein
MKDGDADDQRYVKDIPWTKSRDIKAVDAEMKD